MASVRVSGPLVTIAIFAVPRAGTSRWKYVRGSIGWFVANAQSWKNTRCSSAAAGPSMRRWTSRQAPTPGMFPRYSSPTLKPPVNAVSPSTTTILRGLRRFNGWRRGLRIGQELAHRAAAHRGLAVIAKVHGLEEGASHRQELGHPAARLEDRSLPRRAEREAPEAVDQEAHGHATLRGGHEPIAKPAPRRVVADQVVLGVDVVARGVDGGAERVVHGLSVHEDVDLVSVGGA